MEFFKNFENFFLRILYVNDMSAAFIVCKLRVLVKRHFVRSEDLFFS